MKKTAKGVIVILVLVAVLLLGIGVGAYYLLSSNSVAQPPQNTISEVKRILQAASPTPTPFAFQEMTIPYLRSRKFESTLGKLQEVSENANYTSYVTSFDSDGLRVNGLLTIPTEEQPPGGFPAIVFVHGYIPPEEYQTTVNYNSYVDYFADAGFVVFKIDLRGHGNSEGIPGGGYYSGDYIIDTLNAHAALKNADFVNPSKIGLWGHSMSGNVIFRAFVAKHEEIPAIVIWSGAVYTYSDFSEYSIDDDSYQPPAQDSPVRKKREELGETYGAFEPESEFWKQVPGTNYLDGVGGAIQLNHASNDPVVSIEYSRNLVRILDSTNILHELNEYPSGGHNLTGDTFNQAMQDSIEFFRENL